MSTDAQNTPAPSDVTKDMDKLNESKNVVAKNPEEVQPELTRWKKFRMKIDAFLEHNITVIFMTIITIYALFGDDIRQLIRDKDYDNGFFVFSSVCLALFTLEILLSCLAKPGYFLGFFFWLDVVSTFSLIFDIGWISNIIFGNGGNAGATGAQRLAKAGRASRIGTRAGRIVRVMRLIRLIRIVKLYKAAQTTFEQNNQVQDQVDLEDNDNIKEDGFGKSGSSVIGINQQSSAVKPETGSVQNFERGTINEMPKKENTNTLAAPVVGSINGNPNRQSSDIEQQMKRRGTIEAIQKVPAEPLVHSGEISDQKDSARVDKSAELILSKKLHRTPGTAKKSKSKNFELPQETNVGKKLSTLTTKRVITLVMSVMISIPIFSVDTYLTDLTSGESGLKSMYALNQTGDSYSYELALSSYVREHIKIRNPLVIVNMFGDIRLQTVSEDSLRDTEKQYYYVGSSSADSSNAYVIFDLRDDTHLNAILGIARTLFVTAVLTAAALFFSKDSNDLVLSPIENMLIKVKRIAENPLAAAQIEEEDALINEKLEKEGKLAAVKKKKDETNYETNILEKTILKLGALLALGFGEAGSNIIAQNMAKSGDVDPMIPGKKVMAIFGFCDIRQFTDATEVLQEGVMVFVNEIAEIVHGTINDFSGAANKNIGDAFLLVWKFPQDEVESDADDPSILRLKQTVKVSALADMAVVSFLKVIAGISKSKKLDKYRHNEALNQRMKNFSVKMGFGLHVGWAIEGAIGSEYKIDASYLSPNVNMAARLEAATKQFGVPILISGPLHNICTHETQKQLRHIDRVTVKGSVQPIDLYTCDVDFARLPIDKNEIDPSTRTATEKKQARVESRLRKEDLRDKAYSGRVKISKKFSTDKDLVSMRKPFTREFEDKFKEGVDNYISGNWSKARDCFEVTLKMISSKEKDGPSNTLLKYMSEFGFRAPHDWKGFRELTEK